MKIITTSLVSVHLEYIPHLPITPHASTRPTRRLPCGEEDVKARNMASPPPLAVAISASAEIQLKNGLRDCLIRSMLLLLPSPLADPISAALPLGRLISRPRTEILSKSTAGTRNVSEQLPNQLELTLQLARLEVELEISKELQDCSVPEVDAVGPINCMQSARGVPRDFQEHRTQPRYPLAWFQLLSPTQQGHANSAQTDAEGHQKAQSL
eukprot:280-Hanusia_phi.AAC.1